MNPSTEITTTKIAALQGGVAKMKRMLEENAGGNTLTEFDLPRIKVPTGGSVAYEVQGEEGPEYLTRIYAAILFVNSPRSYWKKELNNEDGVSNAPPDCHSADGKLGVGDPGGPCAACPLAEFGSAKNGRGQACKQRKNLFIVREGGGLLPEVFSVPPTSIRDYNRWANNLWNRGSSPSDWLIEITAQKREQGGNKFAIASFKNIRRLEPEERAALAQYASIFEPMRVKPTINATQTVDQIEPATVIDAAIPEGQPRTDEERPFE